MKRITVLLLLALFSLANIGAIDLTAEKATWDLSLGGGLMNFPGVSDNIDMPNPFPSTYNGESGSTAYQYFENVKEGYFGDIFYYGRLAFEYSPIMHFTNSISFMFQFSRDDVNTHDGGDADISLRLNGGGQITYKIKGYLSETNAGPYLGLGIQQSSPGFTLTVTDNTSESEWSESIYLFNIEPIATAGIRIISPMHKDQSITPTLHLYGEYAFISGNAGIHVAFGVGSN